MEECYLSHEEFVYGLKNNLIKIQIDRAFGWPKSFQPKVTALAIILSVITISPTIIIPIICFYTSKWILLTGYIGYFIGLFISRKIAIGKIPKIFIYLLLFGCIVLMLILINKSGGLNVFSFLLECFTYSLFFYWFQYIFLNYRFIYYLLKHPDGFYEASNKGFIKTYSDELF